MTTLSLGGAVRPACAVLEGNTQQNSCWRHMYKECPLPRLPYGLWLSAQMHSWQAPLHGRYQHHSQTQMAKTSAKNQSIGSKIRQGIKSFAPEVLKQLSALH
jgi:hypothetical protein